MWQTDPQKKSFKLFFFFFHFVWKLKINDQKSEKLVK